MDSKLLRLAEELGRLLSQKHYTMVTAESCTGGWIAKTITDVAGSSDWFERGFVTYSNAAKMQLLGVDLQTIESAGAVSQEVALAMAEGALHNSPANCAVAVTGIAGPDGGTEEKPVGTVWIAWSVEHNSNAQCFLFSGDRDAVRSQTVAAALEGLREQLSQ